MFQSIEAAATVLPTDCVKFLSLCRLSQAENGGGDAVGNGFWGAAH